MAQPLQDGAPRWVRERGQRPVNRLLLNHTVQYARARDCVKHSGDTRRVSGPPRLLVIIGSGEMAPQMGRVHRSVISALAAAHDVPRPVRGTIVDTPYGFQENANALSAEALDYFGRRLGLDMTLAAMPRSDGELLAREAAYARIREAEFVFSGPGSPSYAVSQWRQSEIPTLFAEKLIAGGALVVASAAALTLGRLTAPVYEIYKAGEDPHWLPGLDVLSAVGISAAVIPHWDNAEGRGHDTRYCFLGRRRLEMLEREMPTDVFLLGVDEHTALVIDLVARHAVVRGRGSVTLRRDGSETAFASGHEFSLDLLASQTARAAAPMAVARTSDAELAARVVALERSVAELELRVTLVEPLIEELLSLRTQARAMAAYEVADAIRDRLTSLGVEITDSADGTSSFRLRGS